MQNNILTFREWNENHVKVNFILGGGVEVYTFDKLFFKSGKKERIEGFKNFQNKELLKLYKDNFVEIQKLYTEVIENSELTF